MGYEMFQGCARLQAVQHLGPGELVDRAGGKRLHVGVSELLLAADKEFSETSFQV